MAGNGILVDNYTDVSAKADTIFQTGLDGINIYNVTVTFNSNIITNIGTTSNYASGIVINGNCFGLIVSNNIVQDLRSGSNRTVNYAVSIGSIASGSTAPELNNNQGINVINVATNP
jgi:hypothetical protein